MNEVRQSSYSGSVVSLKDIQGFFQKSTLVIHIDITLGLNFGRRQNCITKVIENDNPNLNLVEKDFLMEVREWKR